MNRLLPLLLMNHLLPLLPMNRLLPLLPMNRLLPQLLTSRRLLPIHLSRLWSLESGVQIRPLQPTTSFFHLYWSLPC